jgi:hypothetical protein
MCPAEPLICQSSHSSRLSSARANSVSARRWAEAGYVSVGAAHFGTIARRRLLRRPPRPHREMPSIVLASRRWRWQRHADPAALGRSRLQLTFQKPQDGALAVKLRLQRFRFRDQPINLARQNQLHQDAEGRGGPPDGLRGLRGRRRTPSPLHRGDLQQSQASFGTRLSEGEHMAVWQIRSLIFVLPQGRTPI